MKSDSKVPTKLYFIKLMIPTNVIHQLAENDAWKPLFNFDA